MSSQVSLRDRKFDTIKSAMALAAVLEDEARAWLHKRFGQAHSPDGMVKAVGGTLVSDLDSTITGLQDRAMFSAIRERSILFRLRGIRRTSFTTGSITSGGALATWVEQGKPIPVHKPTIENVGLERLKVVGMTIATGESLNDAPDFDQILFGDMVGATIEKIDATLLSTSATGVKGLALDEAIADILSALVKHSNVFELNAQRRSKIRAVK